MLHRNSVEGRNKARLEINTSGIEKNFKIQNIITHMR